MLHAAGGLFAVDRSSHTIPVPVTNEATEPFRLSNKQKMPRKIE